MLMVYSTAVHGCGADLHLSGVCGPIGPKTGKLQNPGYYGLKLPNFLRYPFNDQSEREDEQACR